MLIKMRGVITGPYVNEQKGYGNFTVRGYRDGDLYLNCSVADGKKALTLQGVEVDVQADVYGEVASNEVRLNDGREFDVSSAKLTVKTIQFVPVPEPAPAGNGAKA